MAKEYVPIFCEDWRDATADLTKAEKGQVIDALMKGGTTLSAKAKNALEYLQSMQKAREFPHGMPTGRYHWNWKGGITPANQKDRNSAEAKKWRTAVFTRDHFTCQICGAVGGTINAHHIRPWAKFPELRFDVSNGITLCARCHKEVHMKKAGGR